VTLSIYESDYDDVLGTAVWEVHVYDTIIQMDGLHVTRSCNWAKPHKLHGRGGAAVLLTQVDFLHLLKEYARLTNTYSEKTEINSSSANGFLFHVVLPGAAEPDDEEPVTKKKRKPKT
jgi:hypothetical protein